MPETFEDLVRRLVREGIDEALEEERRRASRTDPLVYSVPEVSKALRTSPHMVRRMLERGAFTRVPHMGDRVLIPRWQVRRLLAIPPDMPPP